MIGKHKQKRHGEKETRHNEDIDPHSALSRASRQIEICPADDEESQSPDWYQPLVRWRYDALCVDHLIG
jgi:hypothetical protein